MSKCDVYNCDRPAGWINDAGMRYCSVHKVNGTGTMRPLRHRIVFPEKVREVMVDYDE